MTQTGKADGDWTVMYPETQAQEIFFWPINLGNNFLSGKESCIYIIDKVICNPQAVQWNKSQNKNVLHIF